MNDPADLSFWQFVFGAGSLLVAGLTIPVAIGLWRPSSDEVARGVLYLFIGVVLAILSGGNFSIDKNGSKDKSVRVALWIFGFIIGISLAICGGKNWWAGAMAERERNTAVQRPGR